MFAWIVLDGLFLLGGFWGGEVRFGGFVRLGIRELFCGGGNFVRRDYAKQTSQQQSSKLYVKGKGEEIGKLVGGGILFFNHFPHLLINKRPIAVLDEIIEQNPVGIEQGSLWIDRPRSGSCTGSPPSKCVVPFCGYQVHSLIDVETLEHC